MAIIIVEGEKERGNGSAVMRRGEKECSLNTFASSKYGSGTHIHTDVNTQVLCVWRLKT